MNIFGEGDRGLTNPLTEDLLANQFNLLDVNEIHLNEIHDQDGTGPIVVHERFNMTNNTIGNLADPVAGKDAVTLDYYESNLPVIPSVVHPYDLYIAITDEATALTSGFQAVNFQSPRNFTAFGFKAYLTVAPTNTIDISLYSGPSLLTTATINFGDTESPTAVLSGTVIADQRFEIQTSNADPTAKGLKIVIYGQI